MSETQYSDSGWSVSGIYYGFKMLKLFWLVFQIIKFENWNFIWYSSGAEKNWK